MLELRAIFFVSKSFGRKCQGINVFIESDSTSAIAYIKKCGETRNNAMSMLSRTIWEWAPRKEIHLATHRPGVTNVEADRESRVLSRGCAEWSLDSAARIDCFAQSSSGIFGYAFPPFNLIGRAIRKIIHDGARVILITPLCKSQG
ncbi:hypothetical protein ANCDUO_00359 [Ancylostoma duodenale]|uniref:RNase H type-1 domain-containing protein n=1 Tax=Ancylostoma duodenale TaxID=51022 RepID=A0A0C2E1P9_9BILA|nr:hypothetical protein ANCDUO_00359 [Ancylostoma duodenale]